MTKDYEIRNAGNHRVLSFGGNDYETHYSAAIAAGYSGLSAASRDC